MLDVFAPSKKSWGVAEKASISTTRNLEIHRISLGFSAAEDLKMSIRVETIEVTERGVGLDIV